MSKISRAVQSVVLGGLIFMAAPQKAEAFFLTPPLPFDFEIDIPGDAGKLVSILKATYRKLQVVQSQLNTINLDAIKSGKNSALFRTLKVAGTIKKFTSGPKTPTKGKLKAVPELNLEEGDLNESDYYQAFTRLFLTYPPRDKFPTVNGKTPSHQVIHTAYKHKRVEFVQDTIVDTYLAGRVTEDYLVLVERTLQRLDLCQKKAEGYDTNEKCTFFGLPFVKIEDNPNSESPEEPDENSTGNGQVGEAINNYVISVVYDRLMRIVEDLTATEAIYRSAKQLDIATPVRSEEESSADKYISQKYHFAYNQSHEMVYADAIVSNFTSTTCDGKNGDDCPVVNKDSAELKSIESTELLGKLQPIEDNLQRAQLLHNIKVKMPEYKDLFRRYLKAEEIHKRALKALEDSDNCAKNFIKTYGGNESIWGTAGQVNDHSSRTGVSLDLIKKYQEATNNTIIGSNEKCVGFYEKCTEGYTLDKSKPCEILDDEGNVVETYPLYACTLDVGPSDTGDSADYQGKPLSEVANPEDVDVDNSTYNDADYLGDASKADTIDHDNRIKAEKTWQIGKDALMELTKAGTLKFDPWNDQIELQTEYLRQKYGNIELIVKSMDQGIESFKLSATAFDRAKQARAEDGAEEDEEITKMKEALNTVAGCLPLTEAKQKAEEDCTVELGGAPDNPCTVEAGVITCSKEVEEEVTTEKEIILREDESAVDSDGELDYDEEEYGTSSIEEEPVLDEDGKPTYDEDDNEITRKVMRMENTSVVDENGDPEYDDDGNEITRKVIEIVYKNVLDDDGEIVYNDDGTEKLEPDTITEKAYVTITETVKELRTCSKNQAVGSCEYEATSPGPVELGNGKSQCGTEISLNAKDMSLHFFSDILGRGSDGSCSPDVEGQAKNVKNNATDRLVAQDVLRETVDKRVNLDKDILEYVKDYNNEHEKMKNQLAAKKASLSEYNQAINENTTTKNSAQQEWKRTLDRIDEIDKEINKIEERKPYAKIKKPNASNKDVLVEDKKAICAMDIQQLKLKFEQKAISGKTQAEAAQDWQIPEICDEKTQEDLRVSLGDDFFDEPKVSDYVISFEKRQKDNETATKRDLSEEENEALKKNVKKYVIPDDAQKVIEETKEIITENETKRDITGRDIVALIEKIDEHAKEFAVTYLKMANEAQATMEEANAKFEAFLKMVDGEDPKRMLSKEGTCIPMHGNSCRYGKPAYDSDNLQATMQTFLGYEGDLKEAIQKKMEEEYAGFEISGIEGDYYIDGTLAEDMGIEEGTYTAEELADKIKEKLIEKAAELTVEQIEKSDTEIGAAMEEALEYVKKVKDDLFGEENYDNPDKDHVAKIMDKANYGSGKYITELHNAMVKKLKSKQEEISGEGVTVNVFGIPATITDDTDYFVALPARGNNYLGMIACERDERGRAKLGTDCGAGRDYLAPKEPLLNLPPLREVFFFSPLDYNDTPLEPSNGEAPAITHLLNLKYPNDPLHPWEYLPETWRYLLARPNLRDDGLYQQTFVERAYGDGHLGQLINKNGANNEGYRRILSRGGIYPCKLGRNIIDVDSGNDADDIVFKLRRTAPAGIELQECKEIALNQAPGTSCYLYNKGKNGLCHLMADHGKDGVEDTQTHMSPILATAPLHEEYSELGQFFTWKEVTGPFNVFMAEYLAYRPLQRSVHNYMLDADDGDKQKNDITRQKVETVIFNRNIFSSFLEAVNAEHNAKRGLENAKENVAEAIKGLCSQIESNRPKTGRETMECDKACQDENINNCVADILNGNGFAETAEDTTYGVKGEYGKEEFEGINCDGGNKDSYASYFCQLADWEAELIDKAMNGYTDDYIKDMNGKLMKYAGFNEVEHDKDADKAEERIKNIRNTIDVLEADKDDVVFITPSMTKDSMDEAIKNAKADRLASRESENEGIKSMDNQSQVVPYCPIYINRIVVEEQE